MIIYRIAKKQYANLDGIGGLLYPGRWHNKGQRIIYASQNKSLAILELLVHINTSNIIRYDFLLLEISIPNDKKNITIPNKFLADDKWKSPSFSKATQDYGSNFIKNNNALILKVPSIIVPDEYNFIINPNNSDFNKVEILKTNKFQFDQRLI